MVMIQIWIPKDADRLKMLKVKKKKKSANIFE